MNKMEKTLKDLERKIGECQKNQGKKEKLISEFFKKNEKIFDLLGKNYKRLGLRENVDIGNAKVYTDRHRLVIDTLHIIPNKTGDLGCITVKKVSVALVFLQNAIYSFIEKLETVK